ncbi:MAG: YraN family protein [Acinetobacter towneri]
MNQKILQQSIGTWAEQTAWQYLQQHGWCMLEQNYHSVFGEIDGIFIQAEQLIFVEVKARSQTGYGKAYEVVSASKQRKIMKTAMQFLTEYPHYSEYYCRFDVICFDFSQQFAKTVQHDFSKFPYDLQWIENAFTFDADLINL